MLCYASMYKYSFPHSEDPKQILVFPDRNIHEFKKNIPPSNPTRNPDTKQQQRKSYTKKHNTAYFIWIERDTKLQLPAWQSVPTVEKQCLQLSEDVRPWPCIKITDTE